MNDNGHIRQIDRWLKWVAILGPMVSGVVFGSAGFVGGYSRAKEELVTLGHRTTLLEGWKEKQEDFNKVVIQQIATLQATKR